jgi:hypothetical protein
MGVASSVCLKRMAGRSCVAVAGTWMNSFPEACSSVNTLQSKPDMVLGVHQVSNDLEAFSSLLSQEVFPGMFEGYQHP